MLYGMASVFSEGPDGCHMEWPQCSLKDLMGVIWNGLSVR